ncbi:hypothetical protein [Paenibacillus oleatilyticus]|uniref:hypothetical protein n=1 Tax=Paenibacillus oleatilyticus TaxID=2594886 RepID=UPI001C1FBEBD|nr:hypothetical protein [Paenibacillus oleatilyticus]MBU7316620.1 hypothetical protein [Paenibacillus oleatilyticus]
MRESKGETNTDRMVGARYTETDELGHERNEVAKAEKQAASQETAGVQDPR